MSTEHCGSHYKHTHSQTLKKALPTYGQITLILSNSCQQSSFLIVMSLWEIKWNADRRWGSQYQPYYLYQQLLKFHSGTKIKPKAKLWAQLNSYQDFLVYLSIFRCEWSELDTWGCEKPEPWAHFLWIMVTSAELTQKVRLNHTKYCLMQLMPKKNFITQTSTIAKKKKIRQTLLSLLLSLVYFLAFLSSPSVSPSPHVSLPCLAHRTATSRAIRKAFMVLVPSEPERCGKAHRSKILYWHRVHSDFLWLQ